MSSYFLNKVSLFIYQIIVLSIEVNTMISSYVIDLFSLFKFISFILLARLLFNKWAHPFSCSLPLRTFGQNTNQKPD